MKLSFSFLVMHNACYEARRAFMDLSGESVAELDREFLYNYLYSRFRFGIRHQCPYRYQDFISDLKWLATAIDMGYGPGRVSIYYELFGKVLYRHYGDIPQVYIPPDEEVYQLIDEYLGILEKTGLEVI